MRTFGVKRMNLVTMFRRDERGNVALMTVLTMIPILALLGGSVDVMRATTAHSQMQSALEGAALAAASLTNTNDIDDTVTDYVMANIPAGELRDNIKITIPNREVKLNKRVIEVNATSTVTTTFLKLVGIKEFTLGAESTATQSSTNIELALVLDISSSMNGKKLTNLKDAADGFIEQMLSTEAADRTSINLVPFGGTVNLGKDLFDDYAVAPASANYDPSEADYHMKDKLAEGNFRFSAADIYDQHCIEYMPDDFDDDLLPSQSRPQLPLFIKWNWSNPWCPLSSSAVLMNSNNETALRARIAGMTLSDGTGMDVGALWGLKSLSPKWRGKLGGDFANRPGDYGEETLKVLVIMTDGEITAQFRPRDWTQFSTHNLKYKKDGSIDQSKKNNGNQQTIYGSGNWNSDPDKDDASGHFNKICDDAKSEGILVYTIGFQIKKNSGADRILANCATNAGMYYFVEDLDIKKAFDAIAASVNALRVVG
jgi:Flp pilus assembly protein TadG